jgi:hypothetical protein
MEPRRAILKANYDDLPIVVGRDIRSRAVVSMAKASSRIRPAIQNSDAPGGRRTLSSCRF